MRIRSIKPEFWSSEDIADLDWPTRLLFIGLWSYVDDNGVGRDNEKLIKADLFPLEEDPRDTLATVSRGLQALCDGGQIARYIVEGRAFLYINTWESHQRIDRPNKPRYPLPTCGNAVPRDTLASISRHPRETPATGAGEQRSRGTEEQGTSDADASADSAGSQLALVEPADSLPALVAPTSQTLIGEWLDHCKQPPPGRVKGQVAKEIKTMLEEGINYDLVRAGLAEWNSRGLHPSTLPSVVHEVGNKAPRQPRGRQQETNDLFDAAMERALERDGSTR